jgi:hypothetical protein
MIENGLQIPCSILYQSGMMGSFWKYFKHRELDKGYGEVISVQ